MIVNCTDDYGSEELSWCQGAIQCVSNGSNMPKEEGGFHKSGDVSVLWDENKVRDEEESITIVSLLVSKFNKHVENSWRLDLCL